MSRTGKKPVSVPKGVSVSIDGQTVSAKGPKGELSMVLVEEVIAKLGEDGAVTITPRDESKRARAMWGMSRTLVANMVEGVSNGFKKTLEINGVGYRAAMQGSQLQLQLGFSHDVKYAVPQGIKIETPRPVEIVISGIDKQRVGQVAAEIRDFRPPEPYKGKGIKYADEVIFRKEGKKK
ncbi:50S ribosomal protein L6 [Rhodoligotrophos defluvii]|uniref:50S ribosomal protein L6 n=1 Tax=Rhodoligotrophos defluvii TaxID=2561934 RepID=UPI0010C99918|nr:50S ribosomal protein L6 [Rhodoligotrophos defluvii]